MDMASDDSYSTGSPFRVSFGSDDLNFIFGELTFLF
jgi:hypothetical protein